MGGSFRVRVLQPLPLVLLVLTVLTFAATASAAAQTAAGTPTARKAQKSGTKNGKKRPHPSKTAGKSPVKDIRAHSIEDSAAEARSNKDHVSLAGVQLAELEQELEDINVMNKYDRKMDRLLLVMPLTDSFEPAVGQFGHGHLQTSDRVSLPQSVLKEVQHRKLEFPWQFEIQRVHRRGPGDYLPVELSMPTRDDLAGRTEMPQLSRVTCSPLDARAPEQYIFIPDWMMKSLRLKPRDIVQLRYKNLPQSTGCVHLQAHSESAATSHAVLEEELRHYSSLTAGTTISFVFNPQGAELGGAKGAKGKAKKGVGARREVKINVVQCVDAGGRAVESVCIQDADVGTDWLKPLDKLKKKKAAAQPAPRGAAAAVKGRRAAERKAAAAGDVDASAAQH
ncbi:ubiquitin fusion degradation protein UFD1-domain-containing protein [Tribonema minus]|uniref:Ubiquitin fusion degradation protein UFD1-domain-containing protein n=1 Tax=Tribonema minus TaxID=303371 RepID=A0A835Z4C9_9STRA|nr:ubiquitin fusion degradation protein UFD1-domain-containing protein [Tribonema minus]